jgi:hypothetical protein
MKCLLPSELLPDTLWDEKSEQLLLPPVLSGIYKLLIERHKLQNLANSRDPRAPPVGGLDQEKTDQHFAQAFDGSIARVQLALLDPKSEVSDTSNTFINCLLGNKLAITDAPCGAGAAAFALLANIAELRAQNVLPRQPLEVVLIGAELSAPARVYAQEIFNELRPKLEAQAVFVTAEFLEWDVTCSISNTELVQRITLVSNGHLKRLLVIANFNGFLERDGKRKAAQKQLEELFRHASTDKNSRAVWIEPRMNRVTDNGKLFPWLQGLFQEAWRRFARIISVGESESFFKTSSAKFQLPLQANEAAEVRLAVMPIDLLRSKK